MRPEAGKLHSRTRPAAISGIRRNWNTPQTFARSFRYSSMTYRAIRQLARRIDALSGGLNVLLRLSVTWQAQLHEQRVFPPGHRDLIYRSVKRRALNSSMDVNAVIE